MFTANAELTIEEMRTNQASGARQSEYQLVSQRAPLDLGVRAVTEMLGDRNA